MFNLGTGNGYSVLEVIQSFERSTGEKLNYEIVDRRAGDVEQVWADTNLPMMNWAGSQKGIDEMTLSAWNWELALKAK